MNHNVVIERRGKDVSVTVQNIRLTVKGHYHPPYLWIESYRPRKGYYDIVIQLDATHTLAEALEITAKQIRKVLEEQYEQEHEPCPSFSCT